jgi:pyridoxal phosphate-dependent aminotransferase EpsN
MLATKDKSSADKARFWSTQAREPQIWYEHAEIGFNYRMSNVLAGIGRGQLEVLEERVAQRRAIAARYEKAFADLPGITLMPQAAYGRHTNWLSVFVLDEAMFGVTRDDLIRGLAEENIEARPVWKPMHLQPVFSSCHAWGGAVAEDLFRRGICLPSSSNMPPSDQDRVIDLVRRTARTKSGIVSGAGEKVRAACAT